MKGATFKNNIVGNSWSAFATRDETGNINGSGGFLQEQIYTIVKRLNLTMSTTVSEGLFRWMRNGSITGHTGLLQRREVDISSSGELWMFNGILSVMLNSYISYCPNPQQTTITLMGAIQTKNTLDTWAYIKVFGVPQWTVYLTLLVVFVTAITVSEACLEPKKTESHFSHFLSNIAMSYLFTIQQGSHSNINRATRLLSLTASMLTLYMFICYTNDITAKMTAGTKNLPIRSFDEVIEKGYKVTALQGLGYEAFLNPYQTPTWVKNDSAKHKVYMKYFKDGKGLMNNTQEPMRELTRDSKLLLWGPTAQRRGWESQIVQYDMEDTMCFPTALPMPKDSEFLQIFAHYLQKQMESGIVKMTESNRNYPIRESIEIGIHEPQPLGYENVVLLYTCLGGGIGAAVLTACMEYITKRWVTHKKHDIIKNTDAPYHHAYCFLYLLCLPGYLPY